MPVQLQNPLRREKGLGHKNKLHQELHRVVGVPGVQEGVPPWHKNTPGALRQHLPRAQGRGRRRDRLRHNGQSLLQQSLPRLLLVPRNRRSSRKNGHREQARPRKQQAGLAPRWPRPRRHARNNVFP